MKSKILIIIFISYLSLFAIFGILIPDKEISNTERRYLSTFPEFKFNSEWISKVDKYFLDHFVLRDNFRSLKATYNYKILEKLDNNKIYIKDNYIFKSNYPTNKKLIKNFKNKIKKISALFNEENNVYMMIIPDKNYYLKTKNFLHIDYNYIYKEINDLGYKNIDIRNNLTLKDYYETDTHWKQENLDKIVKKMSKEMNFDYEKINYKENIYNKFYGVYYGESAVNRKSEKLTFLTNDIIDNIKVKYLENDKLEKVYNEEKLSSFDSYEVYLDGASSYIEIFNDNIKIDKELIIFRDSFASSVVPLLTPYYKKITLIDNRYITADNFKDKIDFTNQDIIFMYSTLLINDSSSLKG